MAYLRFWILVFPWTASLFTVADTRLIAVSAHVTRFRRYDLLDLRWAHPAPIGLFRGVSF